MNESLSDVEPYLAAHRDEEPAFIEELRAILLEPIEHPPLDPTARAAYIDAAVGRTPFQSVSQYLSLLAKYRQGERTAICEAMGIAERAAFDQLYGWFDSLALPIPVRFLELMRYDLATLEYCLRRDIERWSATRTAITEFPDRCTEIHYSLLMGITLPFDKLGIHRADYPATLDGRSINALGGDASGDNPGGERITYAEACIRALWTRQLEMKEKGIRRNFSVDMRPLANVSLTDGRLSVYATRPIMRTVMTRSIEETWAESDEGIRTLKQRRQAARERYKAAVAKALAKASAKANAKGEAPPPAPAAPATPIAHAQIEAIEFTLTTADVTLPNWLTDSPQIAQALANPPREEE